MLSAALCHVPAASLGCSSLPPAAAPARTASWRAKSWRLNGDHNRLKPWLVQLAVSSKACAWFCYPGDDTCRDEHLQGCHTPLDPMCEAPFFTRNTWHGRPMPCPRVWLRARAKAACWASHGAQRKQGGFRRPGSRCQLPFVQAFTQSHPVTPRCWVGRAGRWHLQRPQSARCKSNTSQGVLRPGSRAKGGAPVLGNTLPEAVASKGTLLAWFLFFERGKEGGREGGTCREELWMAEAREGLNCGLQVQDLFAASLQLQQHRRLPDSRAATQDEDLKAKAAVRQLRQFDVGRNAVALMHTWR